MKIILMFTDGSMKELLGGSYKLESGWFCWYYESMCEIWPGHVISSIIVKGI